MFNNIHTTLYSLLVLLLFLLHEIWSGLQNSGEYKLHAVRKPPSELHFEKQL